MIAPPGTMFGRYRIEQLLGAGGMGVVYRAWDPQLARPVAIKVVQPAADDHAGRARLVREAQSLARVSHPHVCQVYDVGTEGDEVWVAMELIEGVSLRRFAEDASPAELLAVLLEAAEGIAAAHDASIIHRDVKPENVLVELARSSQPPVDPIAETVPGLPTHRADRDALPTVPGHRDAAPASSHRDAIAASSHRDAVPRHADARDAPTSPSPAHRTPADARHHDATPSDAGDSDAAPRHADARDAATSLPDRRARASRDADARDPAPRDAGARDATPHDSGARAAAPRDAGARNAATSAPDHRDRASRDADARDAAPSDAGARDAPTSPSSGHHSPADARHHDATPSDAGDSDAAHDSVAPSASTAQGTDERRRDRHAGARGTGERARNRRTTGASLARIGAPRRAVVTDFGLARLDVPIDPVGSTMSSDAAAQLTATGALAGTPAYLAPEQLTGSTLDSRVDQFAWAVMCWELVTGMRPFPILAGARLDAIRAGLTPPPTLDRRIAAALARALQIAPRDRFATMHDLVGAIRPARVASHSRLPLALAAAAAGVAATIGVWQLVGGGAGSSSNVAATAEASSSAASNSDAPSSGASSIGAPSIGASSGGAPSTGASSGDASTGAASTGGAPTGGIPTGGAPTGGIPTGGAPTGGASTGAAPTGGASTGAAPTGGASTSGASTAAIGSAATPAPAMAQMVRGADTRVRTADSKVRGSDGSVRGSDDAIGALDAALAAESRTIKPLDRERGIAMLDSFCHLPYDAAHPDPATSKPWIDWGKVTRREVVVGRVGSSETTLLLYEVAGQRATYRFNGTTWAGSAGVLDAPVGSWVALCQEDLTEIYKLPPAWQGPLGRMGGFVGMSGPPRVDVIAKLQPLHLSELSLRVAAEKRKLAANRRYLIWAKPEAADGDNRWFMGQWWLEVPPKTPGAALVAAGKRVWFVVEQPTYEDQPDGKPPRLVLHAAAVVDDMFPR